MKLKPYLQKEEQVLDEALDRVCTELRVAGKRMTLAFLLGLTKTANPSVKKELEK